MLTISTLQTENTMLVEYEVHQLTDLTYLPRTNPPSTPSPNTNPYKRVSFRFSMEKEHVHDRNLKLKLTFN